MSEYEFWNELGNIFNAVVAYQQKTIEFNKRFVNPWIRLGTVFDKNDHNAETVSAYKKAIEIDPQNAANWHALGDMYFKMGSFDDAAAAYGQAIQLDPKNGWAYTNLALTFATRQKYTEAINLYIRSLEFLTDEKDRAMTWNRLGNVYRKVNDYENAFIAFQRADECDAENTGFNDQFDETPEQIVVALEGELPVVPDEIVIRENTVDVKEESTPVSVDSEQPAQLESAEETLVTDTVMIEEVENFTQVVAEPAVAAEETPVGETTTVSVEEVAEVEQAVVGSNVEMEQPAEATSVVEEPIAEMEQPADVPVSIDETAIESEQPVEETTAVDPLIESVAESVSEEVQSDFLVETQAVETAQDATASVEIVSETTVTAVLMHTFETIADASMLNQPAVVVVDVLTEVVSAPVEVCVEVSVPVQEAAAEAPIVEIVAVETEAQPEVQIEASTATETVVEGETQPIVGLAVEEISEAVTETEVQETDETTEVAVMVDAQPEVKSEAAPVNDADAQSNASIIREIISLTIDGKADEVAYEEYLKDSVQPELVKEHESTVVPEQETPVEPVAVKNEIKVELDTKNAHVWNELGNVYFNSGAYEEAITAYGKAIELDAWFAWPYSNLALAYVQKEKYAEAVLLYQRSIELFSSDKDKAITWNRLGNVYRRLNDYNNAIASYQRADELDPNNATRSLRSRFSLLGSINMEQSPSFVV